jgi:hypothetical protein
VVSTVLLQVPLKAYFSLKQEKEESCPRHISQKDHLKGASARVVSSLLFPTAYPLCLFS